MKVKTDPESSNLDKWKWTVIDDDGTLLEDGIVEGSNRKAIEAGNAAKSRIEAKRRAARNR